MGLIKGDIQKQWPEEMQQFKNTPSNPPLLSKQPSKKLMLEGEIQEFKDSFFNAFLTNEEELEKFKPNDEKEVTEQDETELDKE
jgi:hypothetical protein